MGAAFDITLLGDKKLNKAFGALAVIDQRKVMRKSQRAAFKPVLKSAKANAPVRTGKLKKSLKLRALKRSRNRSGVFVRTGTRSELGIPENAKYYYPAHVELGHSDVAPVPFLRNAFDSNKDRVWRKFHVMLWRGTRDVWGRGK